MIDESQWKIEDIASPEHWLYSFMSFDQPFPVEVTTNENAEVIIIPKESV